LVRRWWMHHHVIYRRMARREADLDDAELADLWPQEQRGEAYVEFLDRRRRRLRWDDERHCWVAPRGDERAAV
jgi:hypothetical protein